MAVKQMTAGFERRKLPLFFKDQRKWIPYIFLAPFFITFAIFTLYPILRAIVMGFQESRRVFQHLGMGGIQQLY